ncbi:MAG TPA: methylated-DNA--[protein]-cysteine S-methyltransferase [Mycobacteriales bacterium]|nr:methylated-DNA--[protein]-cysteine S-methyltransferase [Mycobacteriales bacterium]
MDGVGMSVFSTAIGDCGIVWSDAGVCGVQLPEASAEATRSRIDRYWPGACPAPPTPAARRAIDGITALLAGTPDALRDVELDLAGVSAFRREVYTVARTVGPGDTITYGEIASRIGSPHAAREVGQALGANPVPLIVPCHRVLAAGGKLGGFSARGGVTTKSRLLAIEGASLF